MFALPKISANPDVVDRMALGVLRFVDAATGQSVNEGLSVTARVRNRTISAIPSPSGVHIFHQLPGLSAVSFWDGERKLKPEPFQYEYSIEVRDTSRRFFPTTFKTSFFAWSDMTKWSTEVPVCSAAGSPVKKVPLFSSPWRSQRTDWALVRGMLWHRPSDRPAAWALLRVYRDADEPDTAVPLVEGMTDKDGEFMLMFPWPKADPPVLNGPKGLHWTMRFQAWYDLPDPHIPENEQPDGVLRLPLLCSVLKQQPATLLAEFGTDVELPPQEMPPGQTLLLRTSGKKFLYLK